MGNSKIEIKNRVDIISERCKGCGLCIEFCEQHILYRSNETNPKGYYIACMGAPEKCTGCRTCSMICPDFAIDVCSLDGDSGAQEGRHD